MTPWQTIIGQLSSCRANLMGNASDWPPSLMAMRALEVLTIGMQQTPTAIRKEAVMQAAALLLGALERWEINATAKPEGENDND